MENRNMDASTQAGQTQGSIGQRGVVDTVKERASAQLSAQKDRATDGLDAVASAVRSTTQQLRDSQHDVIAQYVEKAVDQVERFSRTIREKDVTELMRETRQLARRQPALFIGGSFVVGLMAARFFKSSNQDGDGRGTDAYQGSTSHPFQETGYSPAGTERL